jgi:transcriptional regulator with PAS, ATPase and Fis domain
MDDSAPAAKFQTLVQSPLRAALLRFLHGHPQETFDIESLMQASGCMRLDVENCMQQLESFGVATRYGPRGKMYGYVAPPDTETHNLLTAFVAERAAPSREERSEAALRFRELMIGRDEKMLIVLEWIRTAAKADIAVLILGPTGTGKELVANMIHELSARRSQRLQALNCAAVPETLFESEIFGHEKGAFTGAIDRKAGKLELADKGSLFLDEIGELSMSVQAKLLRAIEQQRFERLGAERAIEVDFRLISATNQPIEQNVRDGSFREDLYYRVNAFSIRLPSLRERAVDIPILASRFLAQQLTAHDLPPDARSFSPQALELLSRYTWPGNIRELQSVVSRALLSTTERTIGPDDLAFLAESDASGQGGIPVKRHPTLAEAERAHIHAVLESTGWNKQRTAQVLAVSRGTLYRKIEEYRLHKA